jgi:hypothetical protein
MELSNRLRRMLWPPMKRLAAPVWRALQWRVERVVDERVGTRLGDLERRCDAPLNQIASTNAVLREAARRNTGLGEELADLRERVQRLEEAAAGGSTRSHELGPARVVQGTPGGRSRSA